MKISKNTVFITGGSSGIGLALARHLSESGNEVIVCGRSEEKLQAAKRGTPELRSYVCDLSHRGEREALFARLTTECPDVNILVNNAGIQREMDFLEGAPELMDGESEVEINLTAALHLSALFVPFFAAKSRECAVVNVSSGLAFIPLKMVPVYCATKAALHSFSLSLRAQLEGTNTRVFELIPPLVKTDLHRGEAARKQAEKGISPERVAKAAVAAIERDQYEVAVGRGRDLKWAARIAPSFFHRLLNRFVG